MRYRAYSTWKREREKMSTKFIFLDYKDLRIVKENPIQEEDEVDE